ncbi:hypothetical protein E2C01_082011 [Portunus trituberculatus]|uniref:Uncharacterized protein n=1 Tax=Portunus trituberculatus TaxID=210409 RepID=A0A5B7IXY9_PORTR|nr:hypothetical protein [Portunus trituberculatus]
MVCWKGCRPGITREEVVVVVGVKVMPGVPGVDVSPVFCSSSAASSAYSSGGGGGRSGGKHRIETN